MIKSISLRELRPRLSWVINEVDSKYGRFVVTRQGKSIAVILSPADLEGLLETLDILADKEGLERLKKGMREVRQGKTRSLESIRRNLGLL